jgi:hypothetical protein
VAGAQGSAGAGLPPGQKNPFWHCVALAALVLPAAQPAPGAALQLPLQAAEVRPAALPYTPAGHKLHAAAPAPEKAPAGHCVQVALEVALVAALAVPGGQGAGVA